MKSPESISFSNISSFAQNSYPQIGNEGLRPLDISETRRRRTDGSEDGQRRTDGSEDGQRRTDGSEDGPRRTDGSEDRLTPSGGRKSVLLRRKIFEDDQVGEEVLKGNYGPAYCYMCNVM